MKKTFIPPPKVSLEAMKGLILHDTFKRGGTRVGLTRANQLAKRKPLSLDTIKRMDAFFNRHFKNRKTPPEKGNGMIAWLLWGGDAGRSWAKSILRKEE